MATEIDVLYSNFTRARAPLFVGNSFTAEALALRTDGVLCLAISEGWGDRDKLVLRLWSREHQRVDEAWYGTDFYTIGIVRDQFFAEQYDEDDGFLLVRDIANPVGGAARRVRPSRYPTGVDLLEFTGRWVSSVDWQRALSIFENEMF